MGAGSHVVACGDLKSRKGTVERGHFFAFRLLQQLSDDVESESRLPLNGRKGRVKPKRLGAKPKSFAAHGIRLTCSGVIRLVREKLRTIEAAIERL